MSDFFAKLQEATQPARQAMLSAPIIAACGQGDITLNQYQAFLTQAYHHVKHTVPLLMACGARLGEDKEWLRTAIAEYIEEEIGHHEWILNDIRACDGAADDVRQNQNDGAVCTAIELMVAYLYHQIDRGNPLALFGMVWVLEGTSVGIGGQVAQQVKQTLDLPDNALTYLTSHSELDQDHIQFFARLMAQITDPDEQQVIIRSANMVFQLYGQMLQTLTQ
ncbi:TenA family transcriptional regulator [Vibrio mangrovi]|uniref:Heme oxygenase n=1 Tax=Vibrio mangrovi TaxID=474394 RepID=A0A1Y6J1M1_9VIBR|nr:iron-containing redox enzyme family protein [Vibrio mangrovi]MDW6005087.1 iron-containing redox enzyme family protein [Vibrio mangrovi]SMS02990.1 Heme oxygenase [Vibrio mangrovi]